MNKGRNGWKEPLFLPPPPSSTEVDKSAPKKGINESGGRKMEGLLPPVLPFIHRGFRVWVEGWNEFLILAWEGMFVVIW
jgi:hypothetical protein